MALRRNPKLVVADKRSWARDFYLGDGDPKDYPQAQDQIDKKSFKILSVHNSVDFEVGQFVGPTQINDLLNVGWAVDVKPDKD